MSGFALSELHDCWQTLKHDGKMPAERVPLPVRDALKELGLAVVDWFTQDVVFIAGCAMLGFAAGASAQSAAETAKQFAPTGKLRVGTLMLSYFAVEEDGQLKGWSPDLGIELARRLGVPHEIVPISNPADT